MGRITKTFGQEVVLYGRLLVYVNIAIAIATLNPYAIAGTVGSTAVLAAYDKEVDKKVSNFLRRYKSEDSQ